MLPLLDRFLEAATAAQKWRVVRPLERDLQRAMRKAFAAQGKVFLAGFATKRFKFTEALTAADWFTIFDRAAAVTYTLFLDPIQATAAAGLAAGAAVVISDLGVDIAFSLKNPRAVTYLEAHGAELVSSIDDTTRGYLKTVLTQAADEGWSYSRTAEAITDRYREFAVGVPQEHIRSRAELIAVSEIGNAYEEGTAIVVRDLADGGLKMQKSWLTVHDRRVDPHCLDNEAEGWIELDQEFSSGHMQPLAHPACRCTTLYRRAPSE